MKRFVAGPCVIESAELLDKVAETLVGINEFGRGYNLQGFV